MNPKRIQKFFSLQRIERILLLRSFLLVGLIRVGLWVISLPSLTKILATFYPHPLSDGHYRNSISSIAWTVTVASRYIPRATCLVQGLATQVLLAYEGIPSDLCIGVAKDNPTSFEAHAWVEADGLVVIGGPQLHRYTRLTSFGLRAK